MSLFDHVEAFKFFYIKHYLGIMFACRIQIIKITLPEGWTQIVFAWQSGNYIF